MKLALDNRRSDKETWNLETLMLHANFQPKQVNHEISLEEAYKGGEKDRACVSFSRCTGGGTLMGCFPNKQMGDVVSRKETSLMKMGFQHEEVVLFIEEIEQ